MNNEPAFPCEWDYIGSSREVANGMTTRDYYAAEPAVEPPSLSPTAGMNIAQRILHVGGRNNAAGYVEFGSIQAVEALVRQVLRDLPPPPPAEQAKPPGMAVQALAGEIVAALLADEKDGGYDLAAGMFGPAFSALVRRWAAAEWNSPPDEPAVETVAVHQVKLDARRWRDIAKDEMQNYIAQGFWETRTLYTSPPPPAEPARTSQDVCTVPLLSDDEVAQCIKDASKGSAINRDGSTSQRIVRSAEQLVRRKAGL